MHLRRQSGIVCSGGMLLSLHAFVSVRNRVLLLASSVWVMRSAALLWRAILGPFEYGVSHVDKRWDHVSMSLR